MHYLSNKPDNDIMWISLIRLKYDKASGKCTDDNVKCKPAETIKIL